MAKNMVMAYINGQMAPLIKDSGRVISSMVKVNMYGLMAGSILESGNQIICMERADWFLMMDALTKDNFSMI